MEGKINSGIIVSNKIFSAGRSLRGIMGKLLAWIKSNRIKEEVTMNSELLKDFEFIIQV